MFAPLAALALALGTIGSTAALNQGTTDTTEVRQPQTVQTSPAPDSAAGPFMTGDDS
jgi:hypothetical protein